VTSASRFEHFLSVSFASCLLALGACSSAETVEVTCSRDEPIVLGPSTPRVKLPEEITRAVGALYWLDAYDQVATLCTVTRVRPGWVLGAAHCFRLEFTEEKALSAHVSAAHVHFESSSPPSRGDCGKIGEPFPFEGSPSARAVVAARFHPDLDLVLIALDDDLSDAVMPIGQTRVSAGSAVTLAGFGSTELDVQGYLRFLPSKVTAAAPDTFLVDSGPEAGTCSGDSGGPALHQVDGRWELAGTLSRGSPSCTGGDLYVDLAAGVARDWLNSMFSHP
jgi:Trypsin